MVEVVQSLVKDKILDSIYISSKTSANLFRDIFNRRFYIYKYLAFLLGISFWPNWDQDTYNLLKVQPYV